MEIEMISAAILLCGVGTFLLRWLPLWKASSETKTRMSILRQASGAIGPAAAASLLAAMLWPWVSMNGGTHQLIPVLGGLSATWAAARSGYGLAAPALIGAAVYGLLKAWI